MIKAKPPIRKFLHQHDIFGYRIPLSFNGRKSFHTTSTGGIFSIIIIIGYITFFISLLLIMVGHQDDKTYQTRFKNTNLDGVNYRDINMQVYNALYIVNSEGYSESLFLNDDTR